MNLSSIKYNIDVKGFIEELLAANLVNQQRAEAEGAKRNLNPWQYDQEFKCVHFNIGRKVGYTTEAVMLLQKSKSNIYLTYCPHQADYLLRQYNIDRTQIRLPPTIGDGRYNVREVGKPEPKFDIVIVDVASKQNSRVIDSIIHNYGPYTKQILFLG